MNTNKERKKRRMLSLYAKSEKKTISAPNCRACKINAKLPTKTVDLRAKYKPIRKYFTTVKKSKKGRTHKRSFDISMLDSETSLRSVSVDTRA